MHKEFEIYLQANTNLSGQAIQLISNLAIPKTLKRNELILQSGDICRYKTFITKGLLRTFNTTTDGNEHILQFSPEHTWTLDAESYDQQIPSLVNISATEASNILMWNREDFSTLLSDIPELKSFSEKLISQNIYYNRRRMLTTLGTTPEERYADFIQTFPKLQSRLALHMIASYLGISLKTLNRVRSSQLQQSEKSVK